MSAGFCKSMGNFKDLTGRKNNNLKVVCFSHKNKISQSFWKCRCSCGKIIVIQGYSFTSGSTKSCGCLVGEANRRRLTTHGMSQTKFYQIWSRMKGRCCSNEPHKIKSYKEKGIKVCARWQKFENFKNDMEDSYLEHVKEHGDKNTTLDRIDNSKNYHSSNCKWATWQEQNWNRSSNIIIEINGQKLTTKECEKQFKIPASLIGERLRMGFNYNRALNQPIRITSRSKKNDETNQESHGLARQACSE